MNEDTLTKLIEFFQKEQQEALKELSQITDGKQGRKTQQQVALLNSLVMQLIKLRTMKKEQEK